MYKRQTYNLVQYLQDLDVETCVYRNDALSTDDVIAKNPRGIILSPGPSDPDHAGICLELTEEAAEKNIPLLGVCLGHQSIGQVFGGSIIRAPAPMHGKISLIHHNSASIFKEIPSPFEATRYHSLIIDPETLPACLNVTARTEDNIIMGIAHKDKPLHGVQFHPESIATQHGHDLLKNFITLC